MIATRPHGPRVEPRPALALVSSQIEAPHQARWRINGFRATIHVWTAQEWETLHERPEDAQLYSCGIWCALRLD